MSEGAVLGLVALTLALIVAGLFRLFAVLDSSELTLRRLVAEVWAARRAVADRRRAGSRRRARRRQRPGRPRPARSPETGPLPEPGRAGPISLPLRPGPSPLK